MPSLNLLLTTTLLSLTTSTLAVDNARITYYDNQDASNMAFGACEQPNFSLATPYGAAMSLADNGNKQACGKCINVHYGGKSVKVQVVDKCVGCPQGGLDLWAPAFAELAPLGVGVLSASWEFVGC